MNGRMIISLPVFIIAAFIIVVGYIIVSVIVNKKWGYTEKRERELENIDEAKFFSKRKKGK